MAHKALVVLHVAWAALCGGLSVFLASVGGGHPPPLVFVPFVLVAWAAGHLGLWLIVVLARRGRAGLPGAGWPPGLVVALAGLAAVTALTVFQVSVTALTGKLYPYRGALWFVMTGVGAVHAASLVGVLLRRGWGRMLATLVCFGWSGLVATQIADHLAHGRTMTLGESALSLALLALPAGLGAHLLRSARIRAFFTPGA